MAVTIFFVFCVAVMIFGLGFSYLTLRHHKQEDKKLKANPNLPLP